ncbi:MAG: GAF domain-containing protein, partial [Chloroflexi bacterium]|nr:GAF domain-containing protein [Chloroflexota bacterium]
DKVSNTGLPLRLDSPPAQAGYASRITDVPFNAALLVPISWQGQTTGVLSVMRSQPGRPFTQDDENAAQLLAAQAAAALENITLSEQQQHRAVQLQTAAEVSRASSTILQLEELLNTVVELVRDNFNLYYVGTFLLDEQAEWAYLRAGTGEAGGKMLQAHHRLRVDESSMIGWSIIHRQARIALDVGADAAHFDNPLLPSTRSEMALPLISRGRIIGAATIQSTRPAAFTTDDITILQTMADQITTAVENARLFEQAQLTVRQMSALNDITRAVSREIELVPVLEAAYHSLQHLLPLDAFIVALYDPATDQVEYPLVYDEGRRFSEPPATLKPASHVGQVIRTGEAILKNVPRDEWQAVTTVTVPIGNASKPSASLLYVPLKRGDEIIGVLSVQTYQFDAYTGDHMGLLTGVASQLSTAILNARLYEQTRRAVEELNALNRQLTGEAWQSYVQTRSPDAVIWHANDPRLSQVGSQQAEQLAAGEVTVERVANEAEIPPTDGDCLISVPIALRGQLIGALRFRTAANKWDDNARAMATSIAGHLAQAAENTRLIEQTQRTARREQQIAQAADKIHRASDLNTILQTAVQEIARITGSTDVGIQLGASSALDLEHQHDLQPNGHGESAEFDHVSTLA